MRRAAVLAAVGLLMTGSARADNTPDLTQKSIQIPPEALGVALQKFGEIEKLHMVFLTEDVEHRNTNGVSGSLAPVEALDQILRGTGLTYLFLEEQTVMILPVGLAAETSDKGVSAPVNARAHVPQVTVTTTNLSDAQTLEYFRLLAAMSRSDYRRIVKTLEFVDSGTVTFRSFYLPFGRHRQSAGVDGIVLSRVFNSTQHKIDKWLEAYNGNSFPVFIEIDSGTRLGDGAYAALAPGETAAWAWGPTVCVDNLNPGGLPGQLPEGGRLTDWDCANYPIQPGKFHLRMVKVSG
jgi:hypothetical protein